MRPSMHDLNRQFIDLLGLPPNCTRAVLLLQAGDLPRLRVTTVVHSLPAGAQHRTRTFDLVPRDEARRTDAPAQGGVLDVTRLGDRSTRSALQAPGSCSTVIPAAAARAAGEEVRAILDEAARAPAHSDNRFFSDERRL